MLRLLICKEYITPVAALLSLSLACGHQDRKNNRFGGDAPASHAADQKPNARLTVTGTLTDGKPTNSRRHKLHTSYELPQAAAELMDPVTGRGLGLGDHPEESTAKPNALLIEVTLLDGAGNKAWQATQEAAEADWEIPITGAEGAYTVVVEPGPLSSDSIGPAEPWRAAFELDVTQPSLAVDAQLGSIDDDGKRVLRMRVVIDNELDAHCDDAVLRLPDPDKPMQMALKRRDDTSTGNGRNLIFEADASRVTAGITNGVTVSVKCQDAAGNPAELVQPVEIGRRAFSLAAQPVAQRGQIAGDSTMLSFMKPGIVTFDLALIDASTGVELSALAAEAEKGLLRLFVTEALPRTLSDLSGSSPVLWTQPYASKVSFRLPGNYDGKKRVYVTLVRRDLFSGVEGIVSSTPTDLFVDGEGPIVTFTSKPTFAPSLVGTHGHLAVDINASGAPLSGLLAAEYSVDGITWNALTATQSSVDANGKTSVTLSFGYPLPAEKPLRVRLKATDLAGNTTVSGISPSMFGHPGLALDVAANERSACTGSSFKPWLASVASCRKLGLDGTLGTQVHVPLILQNRGSAAVSFYTAAEINAGMGYKVIANGSEIIASGRIEPPTGFALGTGDLRIYNFPISAAALVKDKLELRFDTEVSGAHSTNNACYAEGTYPQVLIQDRAQGLILTEATELPCDGDQALTP